MEVILRKWRVSDADSLVKYANDINVAKWLRNKFPNPYTHQDAEDYIKYCIEVDESKCYLRAITVNDEAIGSIGCIMLEDIYEKTIELGYFLGAPFWGKGIVTRAAKEAIEYCFANYDIVRMTSEPFADNIGSRKVLEKCGFELEGIRKKSIFKLGEFHDDCLYAIVKYRQEDIYIKSP